MKRSGRGFKDAVAGCGLREQLPWAMPQPSAAAVSSIPSPRSPHHLIAPPSHSPSLRSTSPLSRVKTADLSLRFFVEPDFLTSPDPVSLLSPCLLSSGYLSVPPPLGSPLYSHAPRFITALSHRFRLILCCLTSVSPSTPVSAFFLSPSLICSFFSNPPVSSLTLYFF